MSFPDAVEKMTEIKEKHGLDAAIHWDFRRKLNDYPDEDDSPTSNALLEAHAEAKFIEEEEDIHLSANDHLRLVCLLLAGRIDTRVIRTEWMKERYNHD